MELKRIRLCIKPEYVECPFRNVKTGQSLCKTSTQCRWQRFEQLRTEAERK